MSVKWQADRAKLKKEFGDDIDDLLARSPHAWIVTLGFRSFDEQKALHDKHLAGGPLAAPPGRSAHEYGLAVDLAVNTPHGPSWDLADEAWPWLFAACARHPRLRSGNSFPPQAPADPDHVQSTAWYVLREQLKLSKKW